MMNNGIEILPPPEGPLANKLIAALPEAERKELLKRMQIVDLVFGQVLSDPYESITQAYFPLDAMISLISMTLEGNAVEVAIIGREGMHGAIALLEKDNIPHRALVQGGGQALRIELKELKGLFASNSKLQRFLLRYIHALLTQIAQSAVCNRFHSVEQRLARWFLFAQERWGIDSLPWTQEFLAHMLGADRASIAVVMGELKKAELVHQAYGQVTILNREGLKVTTCECYQIVKAEFDDLFGLELHQQTQQKPAIQPTLLSAQ
jgi:CRP-like cAMP-binding protein